SFSHLFDMLLVTNEAGLVTSVLVICIGFFLLISRRPPCSTLFPYTTLFRSMAEQLFGKRRIVGEPITLNGAPYTVVGKIRKKNQDSNYSGPDNNKIFVPFAAMSRDLPRRDAPPGTLSDIIVGPKEWVVDELPRA